MPEACTSYVVADFSGALGAKTAVKPSLETTIVPAIGAPVLSSLTCSVERLTVSGLILLLKPSWITLFVGTFGAPLPGVTEVTAGAIN
jgi:hypothetical protein